MNGTGAAGTGTTFARADHVHPTDTSRAPLASPTFTGTVTAPTLSVQSQLHTVSNISAAGATQATATAITASLTVVTSSTAGTATGVVLPATAGMAVRVLNDTANTITVYVATSSVLNGTTNGSVTINANAALEFFSSTATKWFATTSVYS